MSEKALPPEPRLRTILGNAACSVALCRKNGWEPGDILEGTETYASISVTHRIEICYVGETLFVAKTIAENGKPVNDRERPWTLDYRDWKKVGTKIE